MDSNMSKYLKSNRILVEIVAEYLLKIIFGFTFILKIK